MEVTSGLAGPPATPTQARSMTRSAAALAGTMTPTQQIIPSDPADPLALGGAPVPDPLPAPPVSGVSAAAAPGAKKAAQEAPALAGAPAVGRAKRTRPNVKYSPARTGKVPPRRMVATTGSTSGRPSASHAEMLLPHGEFCDVCGAAGLYVCCDGCPRVFHPLCVNPPLLGVEEAGDHWFCRECTVAKAPPLPPAKGLFSKLILKTELENPKVFRLPKSMRTTYEHVGTHPQTGDYVDESRLKPKPKLDAKGYAEEPDPYRTRTKDGRSIFCFMCGQAASAVKKKRILGCDSCEQFFHLDCLNPPLPAPPPESWKWTCPLHSDKAAPKRRVSKQSVVTKIDKPNMSNNGDIDVIPRVEPRRGSRHVEEVVTNRLRFQIPEDVIMLDFWAKVKGQHKKEPLPAALSAMEGGVETERSRDSSPLTPLSSLESTPEPPVLGRDVLPSSGPSSSSGLSPLPPSPHRRELLLPGLSSQAMTETLDQASRSSSPATAGMRRTVSAISGRPLPGSASALSEAGVASIRQSRSSSRLAHNPSSTSALALAEASPHVTLDDLATIALEQAAQPTQSPSAREQLVAGNRVDGTLAEPDLPRNKTPKRIRIKGTKYLNPQASSEAPATDDEKAASTSTAARVNGVTSVAAGKGKGREVNGFSHASDASDASGAMLGNHSLGPRQPSFTTSTHSPSPAPSNHERSSDSTDLPTGMQNDADVQAIMRVRKLLLGENGGQRADLLKYLALDGAAGVQPQTNGGGAGDPVAAAVISDGRGLRAPSLSRRHSKRLRTSSSVSSRMDLDTDDGHPCM